MYDTSQLRSTSPVSRKIGFRLLTDLNAIFGEKINSIQFRFKSIACVYNRSSHSVHILSIQESAPRSKHFGRHSTETIHRGYSFISTIDTHDLRERKCCSLLSDYITRYIIMESATRRFFGNFRTTHAGVGDLQSDRYTLFVRLASSRKSFRLL